MNLPTHGTSANIRDFDSSVCTGVVQGENTEILFRLLSFPTFYFGRYEFRPLSKDRLQSCGLVFLALSLSLSPITIFVIASSNTTRFLYPNNYPFYRLHLSIIL